MKQNKGITLIALVITIIVLLILAGITIGALLGENGLITKALKAAKEQKKAQYFEEINLEIATEKTERLASPKEETFILSLRDRITEKKWVRSATMEGDLGEITTDEQAENANLLVLLTRDGYEIFIDVDNVGLTASIRDSFEKAGKTYKVKYNKNGGNGEDPEEREVRAGFSIKLPENPYEDKAGYTFVGWSDNKKGEGTLYAEGSYYKPEKDVTLYAIWSKEFVEIRFDANAPDATGEMEKISTKGGQEIALKINEFTRQGYVFMKWNTQADGQGSDYENGATITTKDDITLYAIWERQMVATLSINNDKKLTAGTTVTIGATAYSSDIQAIEVTLGEQTVYTEEFKTETKTYNKAINIINLKNIEELLFNETYDATIKITSSTGQVKEGTIVGIKNYTVGSTQSLTALASAVNSGTTFSGEIIYQLNDITTVADYEPIGYYDGSTSDSWTNIGPYFAGVYNGNKKTINLTSMTKDERFKSTGIFGLTVNAGIFNLTVSGINDSVGSVTGGISAGGSNTTIYDCHNNCEITDTTTEIHGGIVGNMVGGTISNCSNHVSVKGSNRIGGIVGQMANSAKITSCENHGQVNGNERIGGIAGFICDGAEVKQCGNYGRVSSDGYISNTWTNGSNTWEDYNYGILGGIVGVSNNATINQCYNNNQVLGVRDNTEGILSGGIVGQAINNSSIVACENGRNGTVSYEMAGSVTTNGGAMGGIVGFLANSDVEKTFNEGQVDGSKMIHVAGIVGYGYSMTVSNCYNLGTIKGWSEVAGIIGWNEKYVGNKKNYAYNCYNASTNIEGNSNVGNWGGDLQYLEGRNNASVSGYTAIAKQSNMNMTITECTTLAMAKSDNLLIFLNQNNGSGLWERNGNINGGYPYLSQNKPR